MFRRFFRIGFGGCGCALEAHFRDHAVELARELLLECYVEKLKKWKNVLSLDKFEMENVGGLEGNLKESMFNDETFNDKLEEIKKELASWNGSLGIAKERTGMSYEEDIVEELSSIITEMGTEVEKIKNKGSILLESIPVDSYTGSEEKLTRTYAYNQEITETRDLIVDQYEHAVIESEGFNHQPELQMLPFSIREVRNEVYSNLKNKISKENLLEKASRGYLFFVGLGGGTGTGVISPLAERFGKGSHGYFTLGVLGGKEDKQIGSQQPWFRRCFNMLLALNDLMVTAELDGIILLDNDVIIKRLNERGIGVNKEEIDREIIEALYPAFGITALENKENELDWAQLKGPIGLDGLEKKPSVIVPCYASGCRDLEGLIEHALEKGKLANCKYEKNDEKESTLEKVFVYTRCIEDEDAVRKALAMQFGSNDIVIIKEYLFCWEDASNNDVKKVKRFLRDYGIEWADNARIEWADKASIPGKKDTNILKIENNASNECIKIIVKKKNEKETTISYVFDHKATYKGKLPDLKVRKANDVHYIYLKGDEITKKWITTNLKDKKIVVFESQEIGTYWKMHDERYLFNWDNVPGSEEEKLKRFLVDDLGLKWVEEKGLKVEKNSDSITIEKDNHLATIKKKEEEKAILEIKDIGIHNLKVKKEDGNIYVGRKNEVLVLLVNPDIRDVLSERLRVARNFIWLIDSLKTLIDEKAAGSKLTKANDIIANGEDSEIHQRHLFSLDPNFELNVGGIPEKLKEEFEGKGFSLLNGSDVKEMKENEWVIDNKDNVAVEKEKNEKFIIRKEDGKLNIYYPILENLPQDDIDITEEEKNPLAQARNFLLPEELAEKNENIYEHMKEILEKKLMDEGVNACLNLKEGKWPIFKEKIFDITSISGKRDEVILSSISAMNTEDEFKRLVGDAYDTYSKSFQRQFFKYHTHYLYPGSGADYILRDEAEEKQLPEELKNAIDKNDERIKGDDLEELVKEHRDKLVPRFSFSIDSMHLAQLENDAVPEKVKDEFEKNKITLSKNTVWVKGTYLFSWDRAPGEDNRKLLRFLNDDLNFDWVKDATITKSPDHKIISVIGNNPDEKIELTVENTTLKINNGKKRDVKIERVNDKQYIYKEKDTERTIIDGDDSYVIKEESTKLNVYAPAKISFPTMLALAGLYSKWQYLFSWDKNKNNPEDEQRKLIEELFEKDKPLPEYGKTFMICASSKAKEFDKIPNLLILDEVKEGATLIARRSSGVLFTWKPIEVPDLSKEEISLPPPPELVHVFGSERHVDVSKGWSLGVELKDKKWKLHSEDSNTYYYLGKKGEKQFEITGDTSDPLKVKVEEVREESKVGKKSKTLKIYKRRGENFKPAEADGASKN